MAAIRFRCLNWCQTASIKNPRRKGQYGREDSSQTSIRCENFLDASLCLPPPPFSWGGWGSSRLGSSTKNNRFFPLQHGAPQLDKVCLPRQHFSSSSPCLKVPQGKTCGMGGQIAVNWKPGSFKFQLICPSLKFVTLLDWSTDSVDNGAIQFQVSSAEMVSVSHLPPSQQCCTVPRELWAEVLEILSSSLLRTGGIRIFRFSFHAWQLPWSIFLVPWCSTNRTCRSCICCSALWACDVPQDPTKRIKKEATFTNTEMPCPMMPDVTTQTRCASGRGRQPNPRWRGPCTALAMRRENPETVCWKVWCVQEKVGRGGPSLRLSTLHVHLSTWE